jgi:hypothetical protein
MADPPAARPAAVEHAEEEAAQRVLMGAGPAIRQHTESRTLSVNTLVCGAQTTACTSVHGRRDCVPYQTGRQTNHGRKCLT